MAYVTTIGEASFTEVLLKTMTHEGQHKGSSVFFILDNVSITDVEQGIKELTNTLSGDLFLYKVYQIRGTERFNRGSQLSEVCKPPDSIGRCIKDVFGFPISNSHFNENAFTIGAVKSTGSQFPYLYVWDADGKQYLVFEFCNEKQNYIRQYCQSANCRMLTLSDATDYVAEFQSDSASVIDLSSTSHKRRVKLANAISNYYAKCQVRGERNVDGQEEFINLLLERTSLPELVNLDSASSPPVIVMKKDKIVSIKKDNSLSASYHRGSFLASSLTMQRETITPVIVVTRFDVKRTLLEGIKHESFSTTKEPMEKKPESIATVPTLSASALTVSVNDVWLAKYFFAYLTESHSLTKIDEIQIKCATDIVSELVDDEINGFSDMQFGATVNEPGMTPQVRIVITAKDGKQYRFYF